MKLKIIMVFVRIFVFTLLFFLSNGIYASELVSNKENQTIYGAGAHFAWIVFNSIRAELEKIVGRPIVLYGKNSMMGQGCNAGIKMAKANSPGNETFGFVCCQLTDKETKDLIVYPLALEPVQILLNKKNSINNLSRKQIEALFRGEVTNWKDVGGADLPIIVVTRLHCKSRPGHWKRILPQAELFRQSRINVSSADEMHQIVHDFPGAIGHAGSTWISEPNMNVKSILVEKVKATAKNLRNKTYPYFRQLSAVTDKKPSTDVIRIINEVKYGTIFKLMSQRFELLMLDEESEAAALHLDHRNHHGIQFP